MNARTLSAMALVLGLALLVGNTPAQEKKDDKPAAPPAKYIVVIDQGNTKTDDCIMQIYGLEVSIDKNLTKDATIDKEMYRFKGRYLIARVGKLEKVYAKAHGTVSRGVWVEIPENVPVYFGRNPFTKKEEKK